MAHQYGLVAVERGLCVLAKENLPTQVSIISGLTEKMCLSDFSVFSFLNVIFGFLEMFSLIILSMLSISSSSMTPSAPNFTHHSPASTPHTWQWQHSAVGSRQQQLLLIACYSASAVQSAPL